MAKRSSIEVPLAEATRLHEGKWVLMEVTERDERDITTKGIVRASSKSRKKIGDVSLKLRDEGTSALIFFAWPQETISHRGRAYD